jgi:predicted translin family RNA/ssDNA-binding protein
MNIVLFEFINSSALFMP